MYEFHAKKEDMALSVWQRLWQKMIASPAVILLVLAGLSALRQITCWSSPDPVESNYVLTARETLASGDYVSPRIFGNYWYDKPVFFYWELIAAFEPLVSVTLPPAFSRLYSVWWVSSWPMASRLVSIIRRRDSYRPHLADDGRIFLPLLRLSLRYDVLRLLFGLPHGLLHRLQRRRAALVLPGLFLCRPGCPDQRAYRLFPAGAHHPAVPLMAPGFQGPAAHQAHFPA